MDYRRTPAHVGAKPLLVTSLRSASADAHTRAKSLVERADFDRSPLQHVAPASDLAQHRLGFLERLAHQLLEHRFLVTTDRNHRALGATLCPLAGVHPVTDGSREPPLTGTQQV